MSPVITFDNRYPEYAAPNERPVIQKLVDYCLRDNGKVSVWDGEELAVHGCSDKLHILKNLAQTEMDQIEAYDAEGNCRGWFSLIYHNGSENDPMIVISDYSANGWSDSTLRKLDEEFGE